MINIHTIYLHFRYFMIQLIKFFSRNLSFYNMHYFIEWILNLFYLYTLKTFNFSQTEVSNTKKKAEKQSNKYSRNKYLLEIRTPGRIDQKTLD